MWFFLRERQWYDEGFELMTALLLWQ